MPDTTPAENSKVSSCMMQRFLQTQRTYITKTQFPDAYLSALNAMCCTVYSCVGETHMRASDVLWECNGTHHCPHTSPPAMRAWVRWPWFCLPSISAPRGAVSTGMCHRSGEAWHGLLLSRSRHFWRAAAKNSGRGEPSARGCFRTELEQRPSECHRLHRAGVQVLHLHYRWVITGQWCGPPGCPTVTDIRWIYNWNSWLLALTWPSSPCLQRHAAALYRSGQIHAH